MHKISSVLKVLLIGQYPPPIGGVTIHIKRFFERYKRSDEITLSLLDIKKRKYYTAKGSFCGVASLKKIVSVDIVHLHISSNIKIIIAAFYKLLGKKVVYTHHNNRIKNMRLFKVFMLFVDQLILVNDKNISDEVKKYKYTLIPAFLPPSKIGNLAPDLIEKLNQYSHVISSNCSIFALHNNKHLYGFDLIIDAFYGLCEKENISNTLLVLVDPSSSTREYVNDLIKDKYFGSNDILFIGDKIDFVALLKRSSVTIRATRTDGDSISIRESLYYNIPVIASDVTWRPEGTIVFENENKKDLENKMIEALTKKNKLQYDNIDYAKNVIDTYKKSLNV